MKFLPFLLAPLTAALITITAACCPHLPTGTPSDQELIDEAEKSHISVINLAEFAGVILGHVNGTGVVLETDDEGGVWAGTVSHIVDGSLMDLAALSGVEFQTIAYRNEKIAPVDTLCFDPDAQLAVLHFTKIPEWGDLKAISISELKPLPGIPILTLTAPDGNLIAGKGMIGEYVTGGRGACQLGPCFLFRSPVIRPGDSGGMVVDGEGKLIGLIEATILYRAGDDPAIPWASLAISTKHLGEILDSCKEMRESERSE